MDDEIIHSWCFHDVECFYSTPSAAIIILDKDLESFSSLRSQQGEEKNYFLILSHPLTCSHTVFCPSLPHAHMSVRERRKILSSSFYLLSCTHMCARIRGRRKILSSSSLIRSLSLSQSSLLLSPKCMCARNGEEEILSSLFVSLSPCLPLPITR